MTFGISPTAQRRGMVISKCRVIKLMSPGFKCHPVYRKVSVVQCETNVRGWKLSLNAGIFLFKAADMLLPSKLLHLILT